jgi:hypothetical protein
MLKKLTPEEINQLVKKVSDTAFKTIRVEIGDDEYTDTFFEQYWDNKESLESILKDYIEYEYSMAGLDESSNLSMMTRILEAKSVSDLVK